jgi:hypothetical protein
MQLQRWPELYKTCALLSHMQGMRKCAQRCSLLCTHAHTVYKAYKCAVVQFTLRTCTQHKTDRRRSRSVRSRDVANEDSESHHLRPHSVCCRVAPIMNYRSHRRQAGILRRSFRSSLSALDDSSFRGCQVPPACILGKGTRVASSGGRTDPSSGSFTAMPALVGSTFGARPSLLQPDRASSG